MFRTLLALVATTAVGVPLAATSADAAAVAAASSSHRSVRTVVDRSRDVMKVTYPHGRETLRPAPRRSLGDISTFRLAHGEQRVVARIGLHGFRPGPGLVGAVVDLRTPGHTYAVTVIATPDKPRGEVIFTRGGNLPECTGVHARLGYRGDVISFFVPRSCLGSPDWVSARAAVLYAGDPGDARATLYVDTVPGAHPRRTGFSARAWHPVG